MAQSERSREQARKAIYIRNTIRVFALCFITWGVSEATNVPLGIGTMLLLTQVKL
jgi:hypothetical protein